VAEIGVIKGISVVRELLKSVVKRLGKMSQTADALLNNLANTARGWKQMTSMLADGFLVILSLLVAFVLRYTGSYTHVVENLIDLERTWHLFVLMPLFTVIVGTSLGIYRWVVRSTNRRLFLQIVKTAVISALGLVLLVFLFPTHNVFPRSVWIIYGIVLGAAMYGMRVFWRNIFETSAKGQPVAIYGAGFSGRNLSATLEAGVEYSPKFFIDDNAALIGQVNSGLPILSGDEINLAQQLREFEVETVILAMPELPPARYQAILSRLEALDVSVMTVPNSIELVSGRASVGDVRSISVNDILGRGEITPDSNLLAACVTGKNVLVTGGGGSIGSELSAQILELSPSKLVILDNSEFNLYRVSEALNAIAIARKLNSSTLNSVLGSVTDLACLEAIFEEHNIDTVYHAAAYKHVPIIEAQPEQGIEVNVFGTKNVLDLAILYGVRNFMLISTDKAVRPTNSMGATKRIAELVLQSRAQDAKGIRISMVRFGNVLGSSGSVVPKFTRQIAEGGPITLTHRDITRYFMTIPEAAQLVLQASTISRGGDVFVLDMGEPVRIEDLAVSMVKLYGKKLQRDTGCDDDIEIVIEGLRPGEKLYEEMFIEPGHEQTQVKKILTANEAFIEGTELSRRLDKLRSLMGSGSKAAMRAELLSLVASAVAKPLDNKLSNSNESVESFNKIESLIESSQKLMLTEP
jgi:FlaA1/EpsC-like NDP-sugar epimerase